jgi:hypothetical protein
MYDRKTILHLIRDAERRTPYCACGGVMTPVDRDGALWLECITRRAPRRASAIARILSLEWLTGHDRHLILDREELQAA